MKMEYLNYVRSALGEFVSRYKCSRKHNFFLKYTQILNETNEIFLDYYPSPKIYNPKYRVFKYNRTPYHMFLFK